jgi:hypothetical protein
MRTRSQAEGRISTPAPPRATPLLVPKVGPWELTCAGLASYRFRSSEACHCRSISAAPASSAARAGSAVTGAAADFPGVSADDRSREILAFPAPAPRLRPSVPPLSGLSAHGGRGAMAGTRSLRAKPNSPRTFRFSYGRSLTPLASSCLLGFRIPDHEGLQ